MTLAVKKAFALPPWCSMHWNVILWYFHVYLISDTWKINNPDYQNIKEESRCTLFPSMDVWRAWVLWAGWYFLNAWAFAVDGRFSDLLEAASAWCVKCPSVKASLLPQLAVLLRPESLQISSVWALCVDIDELLIFKYTSLVEHYQHNLIAHIDLKFYPCFVIAQICSQKETPLTAFQS